MTAIVRIIAIRDTRQYEEHGDRWVPIPGSGEARPCDRCERDHEVHVDVELTDGSTACIGSGCARGESMDIIAAIRRVESAVKRRAGLVAKLDSLRADYERALAIDTEVRALPLPPFEMVERCDATSSSRGHEIWRCGDSTAWCYQPDGLNDERKRCLEYGWRRKRYAERMGESEFSAPTPHSIQFNTDYIERQILKIDAGLQKATRS